MALALHNTLTRRKDAFEPVSPPAVRMYNCGPTVYGPAHIGNFRAFLFADVLRRWLELSGYAVTQVMNITDVGHVRDDDPDATDVASDKMETAARKERLDPWKIAEKYTVLFFRDLDALGIRRAQHYPRATQYIPQMLAIIERLIETGHAYRVDGNVYYSVATFPDYGKLSGNTGGELLAGARVEVNEQKRDPRDFALWKTDSHHLMQWDSPFGRGFPGWHIECSAMSRALLGEGTLDIHTGGEDNIFPHHECEIAQSEGAFGIPFVKVWAHTRFLQVDGGKMSKSLGNLYTLDDIAARGFPAVALRFLLLRGHYRQVINFTWESVEQSAAAVRAAAPLRGRAAGGGGRRGGADERRRGDGRRGAELADRGRREVRRGHGRRPQRLGRARRRLLAAQRGQPPQAHRRPGGRRARRAAPLRPGARRARGGARVDRRRDRGPHRAAQRGPRAQGLRRRRRDPPPARRARHRAARRQGGREVAAHGGQGVTCLRPPPPGVDYRTQAPDTTRDIEALQITAWREMEPWQKLAEVEELCRRADHLAFRAFSCGTQEYRKTRFASA
jgi:cysteinyl-tRNA synthetase